MFLLDTDTLVFLSRNQYGMQQKVVEAGIGNCAISEISLAELYVGWYKSGTQRFKDTADCTAGLFKVLPISPAVKTYAQIRAQLELNGTRLANMDLLIAATALAGNYTLVSHNIKHFSRIPGLKLKDWTEE